MPTPNTSTLTDEIDLESNQGLATALELLGEANRRAHDGEKMVVEFAPVNGGVRIMDVTEHLEELEADSDHERGN